MWNKSAAKKNVKKLGNFLNNFVCQTQGEFFNAEKFKRIYVYIKKKLKKYMCIKIYMENVYIQTKWIKMKYFS